MEILNARLARPGGNTRAYIDVRFENGVVARNLKLVRTRGGYRVYGPTVNDMMLVAIPEAMADEIAREAVAHVETQ